MFFLRKIGPPALAALLMMTLPVPAPAAESAGKVPQKEQVKEQVKEQAKPEIRKSPGDTMATVNGTVITRQEVDRAVKVMLAQNEVQPPVPDDIMAQAEAAALEQLTSAELLYQEASKLEVKDLDKLIAEKIAGNKAKFASDEEFKSALKSIDMTPVDMENFTRKDIVISNFITKRFAEKAEASEAEARKFYDENRENYFEKPESVRASHILIGTDEKATPEARAKAKEKAEAILKRVKAGEDFAALAKSESSCPSNAQGGDLGKFGRGQMVPAFENAAFGLKVGEVSGVVETDYGYHIVKVTEKEEVSTEKFEDVQAKIVEFLKREKVQKGLTDYVAELKKNAKIEKP